MNQTCLYIGERSVRLFYSSDRETQKYKLKSHKQNFTQAKVFNYYQFNYYYHILMLNVVEVLSLYFYFYLLGLAC